MLFWGKVFLAGQLVDWSIEAIGLTFLDYKVTQFLYNFGVFAVNSTLLGGITVLAKSLLMLKSSPRVQWSPCNPRGSPNGKYHAASKALANSGLPAHKLMGYILGCRLEGIVGQDTNDCGDQGDWFQRRCV